MSEQVTIFTIVEVKQMSYSANVAARKIVNIEVKSGELGSITLRKYGNKVVCHDVGVVCDVGCPAHATSG